tara:strand:+ start:3966 stop:5282 length:1317 start_codon:yes stop_codon:yes gene_type:complete
MSKKYLTLNANNVPASGRVSFARGNPVLTMTIGRQDAMLDMSTLRVSGKLDIWRSAGGLADNLRPTAADASELRGSHKLGIYAAIDQVVFRHAETKQVIEHIRHYGRFMSSYMPVMSSMQSVAGHLSRSSLIMPNYQVYRDAVIRNTKASDFCIPLPSGLTLGGEKVPLRDVPLEIEIHLAPDSQFFYSSDGTTPNIVNCFYELSDIELTCEVEEGSPSTNAGSFSFNSITSYFSTLESTNSIINFNLGLSKVLGAFVNFVPANFVNNLGQDGYLTYMPSLKTTGADGAGAGDLANLERISFLRNGERFPQHFEVDSVRSSTNLTSVVDSQVIMGFMGSIIPAQHHHRTTVSPLTANRNFAVSNSAVNGYRLMPDTGACYGVGQLYDMLDSEGVDFSRAQFSIQMTNGLTDGNPTSAYLFIKSKVVVAFSPSGVQIVM